MNSLIRFLVPPVLLFNLICTENISAQNYEAIKPDAEYFFMDSVDYNIIAIRIDTVLHNGDETVFRNLKQIRPTDYGCFNRDGSSWLGDPVTERPDGMFVFAHYVEGSYDSTDTYRILTFSKLNEPWIFYSLHYSTDYIEAQVIDIKQMSFIGITDSVKIISLTRKNSLGQTIYDPVNSQKILLSKNHGLIRLPKFDEFRSKQNNPPFYDIAGKTNPVTGITNLKTMQIYDFQPGDEFHKVYAQSEPFIPFPYATTTYTTIEKIVERINYPATDSVSYRIEKCTLVSQATSPTTSSYSYSSSTYVQTFSSSGLPELETEPLEPVQTPNYNNWITASEMGMLTDPELVFSYIPYKLLLPFYMFQPSSEYCLSPLLIDDFLLRVHYYFKGLGGPYFHSMDTPWSLNSIVLKYYKKGSKSRGTPLSCDSLMQVGLNEHAIKQPINLFPNPVQSALTVSVPDYIQLPGQLRIFDISGRLSEIFTLTHSTQLFDLSSLPAGIYIYQLTSAKQEIYRGKIVRQ